MPTLTPTVLTTGRLKLRWLDETDAAAQFAIYSDPVAMRYWSNKPWTGMDQAHEAIAKTLDAYREGTGLRFGIELQSTGEMIGNVNLYDILDANRRCDVGYALARAHWRQGYLGEALPAALDYAFTVLGLNRIEADIDPRNIASEKLLQRMGFRQEGYLRERWIVNGEMCDAAFYGLLLSDWTARA